jgi:hypothetical protein
MLLELLDPKDGTAILQYAWEVHIQQDSVPLQKHSVFMTYLSVSVDQTQNLSNKRPMY